MVFLHANLVIVELCLPTDFGDDLINNTFTLLSTIKVVNHVRRLITEMIEGVIESSRGGEIKVRACDV